VERARSQVLDRETLLEDFRPPLLFFAVRWKSFPNICTTYHPGGKKRKGERERKKEALLKVSIRRAGESLFTF
jgi:hypothetical protein